MDIAFSSVSPTLMLKNDHFIFSIRTFCKTGCLGGEINMCGGISYSSQVSRIMTCKWNCQWRFPVIRLIKAERSANAELLTWLTSWRVTFATLKYPANKPPLNRSRKQPSLIEFQTEQQLFALLDVTCRRLIDIPMKSGVGVKVCANVARAAVPFWLINHPALTHPTTERLTEHGRVATFAGSANFCCNQQRRHLAFVALLERQQLQRKSRRAGKRSALNFTPTKHLRPSAEGIYAIKSVSPDWMSNLWHNHASMPVDMQLSFDWIDYISYTIFSPVMPW